MKATILMAMIFFYFIGCVNEVDENQEVSGVAVELRPLRNADLSMLMLVDSLGAEVNDLGYPDTTGSSVILLHGEVIYRGEWRQGAYHSPIQRTKASYAECLGAIIIFISNDFSICDYIIVIRPDSQGRYNRIREGQLNLVTIKKLESVGQRHLRITYNNSWTRTGGLPDRNDLIIDVGG